jgi:hypothetical protein
MMELMIAMGILAVGMAMSASLFPTAAKEANTAIGSAMGQTIAENGLAMGKLAFRSDKHSNPKVKVKETWFWMLADSGRIDEHAQNGTCYDTSILTSEQMRYPMGDTSSKYGFALAAHKVSADADAYQIVSTAYRKQKASNKVDWDYILIGTGGTTNVVTITGHGSVAAGSQAYVNSPLILFKSGRIATVIAQNGVTLTLDRKIEIPGTDIAAVVLREHKGSSSSFEYRSPAIYTMTVTTALDD